MNTHHLLSGLLGVAILIAPPALDTTPVSPVPTPVSGPTLPHPHHNHATVIPGVKGKVVVTWFTVPFNPDRIAELPETYQWHVGFASLQTEVPLLCGKQKIPIGRYTLNVKTSDKGKTWHVVLLSGNARQLKRQIRRARGSGDDVSGLEAKLAAIKSFDLPALECSGKHHEHMSVFAINYGYKTTERGSTEATGGVRGEFRISFGDLHTGFALSEIFDANEKGEKRPRRP